MKKTWNVYAKRTMYWHSRKKQQQKQQKHIGTHTDLLLAVRE